MVIWEVEKLGIQINCRLVNGSDYSPWQLFDATSVCSVSSFCTYSDYQYFDVHGNETGHGLALFTLGSSGFIQKRGEGGSPGIGASCLK